MHAECFINLPYLVTLNASQNKLKKLVKNTFLGSKQLKFIDISNNLIAGLEPHCFTDLINIHVLNLTGNLLEKHESVISYSIFVGVHIHTILTTSYKVCCLGPDPKTVCNSVSPWPHSCNTLLGSVTALIFLLVLSGLGISFNSILLFVNRNMLKHKNSNIASMTASRNYKLIVICIAIGDVLTSFALLILGFADIFYRDEYLVNEYNWRKSFACHMVSTLLIASNIMSCFSVHFMALSRYFVTKGPLDTRFLNTSFVKFSLLSTIFFGFMISCILMVSYRFISMQVALPTGLCMLLGNSDSSISSKLAVVITLLVDIVTSVSITVIYYHINKLIAASEQYREKMGIPMKQDNDKNIALSSVPNAIIYLTHAVIFLSVLSWKEYPYQLYTWAVILLFPLHSIINPLHFYIGPPRWCVKRKFIMRGTLCALSSLLHPAWYDPEDITSILVAIYGHDLIEPYSRTHS